MKKYILSAFAVAGLMAFTSCSDFLDVEPQGAPTTTTYFTNDQQAIDAIDKLYARLHQENVFGREFFWEQGGGQDVVWGRSRGYKTLATHLYTGDESPLRDTFKQFYNTIARANWVIEKLLDKEAEGALTAVEKRSLGEALFVRAQCHFYIAYRYGTAEAGVPFVRYEDTPGAYEYAIPPQRASVMENYKLIVEDLDKAITYLPKYEEYDDNNLGRAHKAAAVAYKAKTYAYWACWDKSQWNNVIACVDELEKTYGRDLCPSYDELFCADASKFFNKEYLWSIPGHGGATPGGVEFPGVSLENKGWGKYNGWGQNKPSYNLYAELLKDGEGNVRLKRNILAYGDEFQFFGETRQFFSAVDIEVGFTSNKYLQAFEDADCIEKGLVSANGDWPTTLVNFPLIRMAEMYLFRAEAKIMLGQDGTADINKVRQRSGLAPVAKATMADVMHERRCELAFEYYDALYDLKRWHKSCPDLKDVCYKALSEQPLIMKHEDRSNPASAGTVAPYEDNEGRAAYDDHFLVFPYPSQVLTESNGQLKQNKGY